MPKLVMSVPHTLGQAEALSRVQGLMAKLKERNQEKYSNLVEEWQDNSLMFGFSTYGLKLKGTMNVTDTAVNIDGDLPFTAVMFKGRIEKEIRETLERYLR